MSNELGAAGAKPEARNGVAVAALVLGIAGIVLSPVLVGGVFGLLALALGIVGVTRRPRRGMAIAGIVMGVFGMLLAVAATGFWAFHLRGEIIGREIYPKDESTRATISLLKIPLDAFEVDNGRYPTTEEGLESLVRKPADLPTWNRPYIDKVPLDAWGRPFHYRWPSIREGASYDLWSDGPDGIEGTPDDISKGY